MSREEAIDIIKCLAWHTRPNEEDIEQAIKALEKEPKTGYWIDEEIQWRCSECDWWYRDWKKFKFCPNCGARMVEPQESEDK